VPANKRLHPSAAGEGGVNREAHRAAAGEPQVVRPHERASGMTRKYIAPGTQLAFRLSKRERDLVIEKAFLDPEVEQALHHAQAAGSKLVARLTLDDIDDLLGCVAAEANHCDDGKIQRVLDAVCDRLGALLDGFSDEVAPTKTASPSFPPKPRFTAKQGQYLAFIDAYTKVHRQAPAEADLQQYFRVTPPAVHTMVVTLDRLGLIERTPGRPRSIRLRIPAAELPALA